MNRTLVLVRHGQSEWNAKNLFTGWKNPDLTPLGIEEARRAGRELRKLDLLFSVGFTSAAAARAAHARAHLSRSWARRTCRPSKDRALNERHYGDLSGLNKDEARDKWGEEQVRLWRRSYDVPPPGGESLKDTVARVVPFYVPADSAAGDARRARAGGGAWQFAARAVHGAGADDARDSVPTLELATGVPIIYRLNANSTVATKTVLDP